MISIFIDELCGIKTKKINLSERCFYCSLFFFMCYSEIKNILSEIVGHTATLLFLLTYGLLITSLVLDSNKHLKKTKFINLGFIVTFIGAYFLLTFIFHPEYSNVLFGPFSIIDNILFPMSAFWALLFFSHDADNNMLLKTLFLIAVTRWGLLIFEAREVLTSGFWTLSEPTLSGGVVEVLHTYNINWAYKLFATECVFLVLFYRSKKRILLIPIIIGEVFILLFGSRGAFFMFFLFWILCFLFCNADRHFEKRTIRVLMIGAVVLLLFTSGVATKGIINIIERTGVTSRTIVMFLNGELTSDSGRNQIYAKALEMLRDVHIFGYGIYGDRYHVLSIGQIAINGYGYVHNVFLEILITYGVFGVAIIYIGIKRLFVEIVKGKNFELKCLFLICFGCSLNLMFSSSYWYQYYFWAMIGLMIRTSRIKYKLRHT